VMVKNNGAFGPGMFCNVKITASNEFDLFAEVSA
jgi:hypothetical protein